MHEAPSIQSALRAPVALCRARAPQVDLEGGCPSGLLTPLNVALCDDVLWVQGEHGTGRNVAPYVEMEWGTTAYELMWQLKELFDPNYVLNPGVILNSVSCS